jgi:hypothetical protein
LLITTGFLNVFVVNGVSVLYTICIDNNVNIIFESGCQSIEIDAKRMVVYIANKIPRPVVYGPNTFSILELLIRISKQKGTNTAMLMIKDAFIMFELI